jgi:hypothetical protein
MRDYLDLSILVSEVNQSMFEVVLPDYRISESELRFKIYENHFFRLPGIF